MDAAPRRSPDVSLFAATVALIGIGIVMIYSASAIVALDWFGDSAFFLKRQLLWSVLGLGVMSVSLTIHYQRLRRITPALLLLVAVALVAVLIPGIGRLVGGARRWLVLGPASFQPAEAGKLFLVLYLANHLTHPGGGGGQISFWPSPCPTICPPGARRSVSSARCGRRCSSRPRCSSSSWSSPIWGRPSCSSGSPGGCCSRGGAASGPPP